MTVVKTYKGETTIQVVCNVVSHEDEPHYETCKGEKGGDGDSLYEYPFMLQVNVYINIYI